MFQIEDDFFLAADFPDAGLVIQAGRNHSTRIRTERRVVHPLRVLQRPTNLKTCSGVPDAGGIIPTGRDDEPIVCTKRDVKNNVGMPDKHFLRLAAVKIPHPSNFVFASGYNSRSIRTESNASG